MGTPYSAQASWLQSVNFCLKGTNLSYRKESDLNLKLRIRIRKPGCFVLFPVNKNFTNILILSPEMPLPLILFIWKLPINQWFLTGGDFCPQGTFGNNWNHYWSSQLGEWRRTCSRWRLGMLLTSYNAQDSPQSKELSSPKHQLFWGQETLLQALPWFSN